MAAASGACGLLVCAAVGGFLGLAVLAAASGACGLLVCAAVGGFLGLAMLGGPMGICWLEGFLVAFDFRKGSVRDDLVRMLN